MVHVALSGWIVKENGIMYGQEIDFGLDVGVMLSACYPNDSPPDVVSEYLRSFACVWNRELVGDIPHFGNNFATTLYGIASIFEKVLKFTGSIVDFYRSFKCCA